jgi:3-dehydroquinate synthase
MMISGRVVEVGRTRVVYGTHALSSLQKMISGPSFRKSKAFILADNNTRLHCLPLLIDACPALSGAAVLEIEGGEHSKTLSSAERLWTELVVHRAGRDSFLVNLGGGVVSDLGGFVAAGFKRGIRYINVPTSLTGMVDAAIGGKTGINLQQIKNQVGFFYPCEGIFIDRVFLATLPGAQLKSGLAEVIKSALLGDPVLWRKIRKHGISGILNQGPDGKFMDELIMKTVVFKNRVSSRDFREKKLRKILNFGHTFGHALEAFSLLRQGNIQADPQPGIKDIPAFLLHGDAVALGMIAETGLSVMKTGFNADEAGDVVSFLKHEYSVQIDNIRNELAYVGPGRELLFELMTRDKKNKADQVIFTLLQSPGKPKINIPVSPGEIMTALDTLFT